MSRREAKAFLEKMAEKYYRGEISLGQYRTIDIKYTPLDLSKFPQLTTETGKWLNAMFTEETTNRHGEYMLKSHAYHPLDEMQKLNCIFRDGDGIHCWGYNDNELLIYEYCEGDTYCTIFKDRESYKTEKKETIRWWKEER